MSDKLKELRDKNPVADFVAGFIPGVGEFLDAQDLYYAAKKGDVMEAGLYSLGLLLPGIAAGLIKKFVGALGKLTPMLKAKGWKVADDGESFISPDGISFMRNKEGKLMTEKSLANDIKFRLNEIEKANFKKLLKQKMKLYLDALDKLDELGFIDFQPLIWFKERNHLMGSSRIVTQKDIDTWMSHMPEYLKIAEKLLSDNKLIYDKKTRLWLGKFKTKIKPVNPAEYIVSQSSNFKKSGLLYDGDTYYSGMGNDSYNKLLENGGLGAINWTTTAETYAKEIAQNTGGPVVKSIVGGNKKRLLLLPFSGNSRPTPNDYSSPGRPVGADIVNKDNTFKGAPFEGVIDIPEIYTKENQSMGLPSKWRIFGPDTQIKVLRGNNGDFNLNNKNIYRSIIPIGVGTTTYGLFNNELISDSSK